MNDTPPIPPIPSTPTSHIATRDDFLAFMKTVETAIRSGQAIENDTVASYLGALIAWVEDMDGYYTNLGAMHEAKLEGMNWRVLADMLMAATMYE